MLRKLSVFYEKKKKKFIMQKGQWNQNLFIMWSMQYNIIAQLNLKEMLSFGYSEKFLTVQSECWDVLYRHLPEVELRRLQYCYRPR